MAELAATRDRPEAAIDPGMLSATAGLGRSIGTAKTLPPAAYTSQAVFDLEIERIFKKDWLCVGHVSQVAAVGDYFTVDLFGEPIVVVRGPDRIRALSRVCLHRWAPVVEGTGNAKIFSCPFHKWGYALDGQLLGAPFMEQAEDFQPKECRLPEIRSEIVAGLGLIFITFSDTVGSIAERLGDLVERYAHWRMDRLVALAASEANGFLGSGEPRPFWTENRYNWKIQAETFMECYHHIGAHPETFEVDQPARLSWCEPVKPGWTVCHSPYRPTVPDEGCTMGFEIFAELDAEERRVCDYILIFPHTLLAIRSDGVGVMTLVPVAPSRTLSRFFTLVAPETAANDAAVKDAYEARRAFFAKAVKEDNDVNEMQQAGAASRLARIGPLSHLESTVGHLADYVSQRLGAEV